MTNNLNSDQTALEQSDQGLHYLPKSISLNLEGKCGVPSFPTLEFLPTAFVF